MASPYITYLVYGYIYDSCGNVVPSATLEVETSIAKKKYSSDSSGIYLFDLAELGYTAGATKTDPTPINMYGTPFSTGLRITVSGANASVTVIYE